ncbi:MAG: VWA domain-containing protein, partial [Phreatobacter sp.]
DEALAACTAAVEDWSGGTRIAPSLHAFNKQWSRRVLSGGAVVLLVSDGLERDGAGDLAREADRLHRSCRRLVWLNPLLRWDGFEARAQGIRALLPHVDEFRTIHNIAAVADLVAALDARRSDRSHDPRLWLKAA